MAWAVETAGLLGECKLGELGDVEYPYTAPAGRKTPVAVTITNGSGATQRVRAGFSRPHANGVNREPRNWALLGGARGFDIPPGGSQQFTTMVGGTQGICVQGPNNATAKLVEVVVVGQQEVHAS